MFWILKTLDTIPILVIIHNILGVYVGLGGVSKLVEGGDLGQVGWLRRGEGIGGLVD